MSKKSNPWRVELKEQIPNEMERYSLYSDFTSEQKRGFIEMMKFVDSCITRLQDDGELTKYIKINARIKSAENALKNDDKPNKVLDDVFGMEILAGNENALIKIINELKKYMLVIREKTHNKDNGYNAIHKVMTIKKDVFEKLKLPNIVFEKMPVIEIQFKTFEVKENATSGPANHLEYKGQTREQIQKIYDNNEFNEYNLPIMYTIDDHKIRILDKNETIEELYPFLKLKDRGREVE